MLLHKLLALFLLFKRNFIGLDLGVLLRIVLNNFLGGVRFFSGIERYGLTFGIFRAARLFAVSVRCLYGAGVFRVSFGAFNAFRHSAYRKQ